MFADENSFIPFQAVCRAKRVLDDFFKILLKRFEWKKFDVFVHLLHGL